MKISFTMLSLWAISFHVVKACNVDMPSIMMVVQFAGRAPADPVTPGGSVPNTVVLAYFPGDAFGFSGSDGLLLDFQALDDFLEALSSTVGTPVDVNATLSLVVFTVTGSDETQFKFDDTNTKVFEGGVPINVASYQCAVVIRA